MYKNSCVYIYITSVFQSLEIYLCYHPVDRTHTILPKTEVKFAPLTVHVSHTPQQTTTKPTNQFLGT